MKGCRDMRVAREGKKMAEKGVKHNREQFSVVVVVRATIAVAIQEH